MATLLEFAGTRRQPTATSSLADFVKSDNSLLKFAEGKNKPKEKSKLKDTFRYIGKQLMKPVGVASEALETASNVAGGFIIGKGIETAKKEIPQGLKDIKDVVLGKKETSFSQKFTESQSNINRYLGREDSPLDKFARVAIGLGGDIVLDPFNKVKPVKVAKELADAIGISKPIGKVAGKIAESSAFKKARSVISNSTGDKAFDDIVKKFRALRSYREENLIRDAQLLQKELIALGKSGIKNVEDVITEGLENPKTLEGASDAVKEIVGNLKTKYKGLLDEANKLGLGIGEIKEYAPHIRTKQSFINSIKGFGIGAKEWSLGPIKAGRKLEGTIKELGEQGIDIFEKNPAIQLAKKGQAYVKAITSKGFANEVGKFATEAGVKVLNPLLKDKKFAPEVAKVIDNFYQGIKPDELNVVVRAFDKIQNVWKAQALVAPSYHIRNAAGNIWNNFVAGVNPAYYIKATMLQTGRLKDAKVMDDMSRLGVVNRGWYAADIAKKIEDQVAGVGKVAKKLNPLSQDNYLFEGNQAVGKAVENNARIAHYLSKLADGFSPEKAAESVKKYLFDYEDLTKVERTIFKRIMPFYTWTRKNIPVQLEGLITQPAKYALPQKLINFIESGVEVPNEKYLGSYIKENIPVRIRKDDKGNTEYFLLGTWLPFAAAIDTLSHPIQTIIQGTSPIAKAPLEWWGNKSWFFKNTLGEGSQIEARYKQQGEFIGMSMRRKMINVLRNIRLLNDMNRWVDSQDPDQVKNSFVVKLLNTLFGKTQTYDVGQSKYFYNYDTDKRVLELESAIKDAKRRGYKDQAEKLKEELKQFKKERGN